MSAARKVVLFTAQEPSGDAHAAPVIARLREAYPDIEPVAWGGPKMAAAGATMLGRTADDGVMGLAGISKVAEVKRLHDEIVAWARANPVAVHMPVDSPSANYPLCARLRPLGARIVNLVAPQLWAWAPWRIGKVRRLSDVMLCLLPFEEEWFRSRGVTAKFVGHPVLSKPLDLARCAGEAARLPQGAPRVLLLPGSRSSEVRRNGRLLAEVFARIRAVHAGARAVAVASSEANAERFLAEVGGALPDGVSIVVAGGEGREASLEGGKASLEGGKASLEGGKASLEGGKASLEGALAWCDLALAVSGTVSLDCTRQAKPVIGVYRTSLAEVLGAKLVIRAPSLLLPNILAGRRIVPEFVPYAGGARKIADEALAILGDPPRRAAIERDLRAVADQFLGRDPAPIVAEIVAREARGTRVDNDALDEIVGAFSEPCSPSRYTPRTSRSVSRG